MALKTCKECGKNISAKAKSCPGCGAPNASTGPVAIGCLVIFLLFGGCTVIAFMSKAGDHSSNSSATVNVDASPAKQAKRKAFISKLIGMGVIHKVTTPGSLPHIYVAPGFYQLDIDKKTSFINAVFTYYYAQNNGMDLAILYDSKTGKKIGTFSAAGLDLD